MIQVRALMIAATVALSVLVFAAPTQAGPILTWLGFDDNPPRSYSPYRYWAPYAARVNDHFHGPRINVFPPDRHPEVPPENTILTYPTQIALPGDTIIPRPTPPATSAAR